MTLHHHVFYLPISLSSSTWKKWTGEWEGNLSHEADNRDPHPVNRVKLPRSTNPSSSSGKPQFRGPLVPDAYWPPSNWHDPIYLSWAEGWCEKQTTENKSVQRKEREKMQDAMISWFCWKKVIWEVWNSRAYLWVVTTTGKESPRPAWLRWRPVWDYLHWTTYCSKQGDQTDKKKAIIGSTLHYFPLISSTEQ